MIISIKDKWRIPIALVLLVCAVLETFFVDTPLGWDIARFLVGLALGIGIFRSLRCKEKI